MAEVAARETFADILSLIAGCGPHSCMTRALVQKRREEICADVGKRGSSDRRFDRPLLVENVLPLL